MLLYGSMVKAALIIVGTLSVGLGFLGILLPGLPTTPFLLVAAGCYARSSDRLYTKLLNSRRFGPFIRRFREDRAIPRKTKVQAIVMMWSMILLSGLTVLTGISGRIILAALGTLGTLSILLIRTSDSGSK